MSNVLLLVLCFALAPMLRRLGRLPDATPQVLNAFIVHVALPATVLHYIPSMRFDTAMWFAAFMAWAVFAAGAGLVVLAARAFRWDAATTGCVMLVAGLGNTSFLGLPMVEAFHGGEGAAIALVCDQAGSFLVLSTLGLAAAAHYSGGSASPAAMIRRIALFPPFLALVAALLLRPLAPLPELAGDVFARLASTLAPLALFSVGAQIRLGALGADRAPLLVGLAIKLLVAPVLIAALALATGTRGTLAQVSVMEAAMPPMITAGIVATEHGLNPRLANLLVGIGIVLSFASIPVVWWLSRGL